MRWRGPARRGGIDVLSNHAATVSRGPVADLTTELVNVVRL
jgi:hypothetical protein